MGPFSLTTVVFSYLYPINTHTNKKHIAKASIKDFPNLDINTDISFTQFYAWGVGKYAPILLDSLNSWLDTYTESKEYKQLYNKYFN
jgi:ABC-type amino acid transport substrate-binding protein